MRIDPEVKLDFCDVLLRPNQSNVISRGDVDLTRSFTFLHSQATWSGIPIMSSNMSSVTTPEVAREMNKRGMLACIPKTMVWEGEAPNYIPSIGLYNEPKPGSLFLCLDVPHAGMRAVIDRTKELRDKYPEAILIVGNVVTSEETSTLIGAGANVVKVGIGSGAACSTRIKTGVGMPQLSAVIECSIEAHDLGGHIISDGGCTTPGDIVKAFAAGADFVMIGGMLAGHLENGTSFYGMSSERANNEFAGGLKDYRAAEGWEMTIPSRGPMENTLKDILGGLRSACSYIGAHSIEEMPQRATFIRVNRQANQSLWQHRMV